MPVPATRSMASFGLTNILTPAKASNAPKSRKITKLNKNAMALYLDLRDLFHDEESGDLQGNRAAHHDVADVVQEEELHIVRVGVKHQHRDANGDAAEGDARHPPVRANRADTPAQLEALPDHVSQFVQDLGQVAAGALLQQHGGNKEVHVERRYPLGQFLQRDIQR